MPSSTETQNAASLCVQRSFALFRLTSPLDVVSRLQLYTSKHVYAVTSAFTELPLEAESYFVQTLTSVLQPLSQSAVDALIRAMNEGAEQEPLHGILRRVCVVRRHMKRPFLMTLYSDEVGFEAGMDGWMDR